MFAMIVEYFGTRTAWACITHSPEVIGGVSGTFIVADADNTLSRHTNGFQPDIIGFIVSFVDSYPKFFFR